MERPAVTRAFLFEAIAMQQSANDIPFVAKTL
jgi:hypothetical protein